MLTVVCFLWYDPKGQNNNIYIYSYDHVRILQRSVKSRLNIPHKFVCVTDNPGAFADDPEIHVCQLDRTTHIPGTRYAKLMLFRRDIADLIGQRILYLDLDCVPVRALDPLVNREEPLVLWKNPNYGGRRRAPFNSSMMLLDAACRPYLYERFDPHRSPSVVRQKWGGTDQAWISHNVSLDNPAWSNKDGVYGAGRLLDIVPGVQTVLPENARIVFFPGRREPGMKQTQELHPWIKEYRK